MSVRGGGKPREQARRMTPGSYEGAQMPSWRGTDGRGGPGPGRSARDPRRPRGIPGIVKFVGFTAILAILVVVAALTAFRSLTQAFVVSWAWDNTGSMRNAFVADFVRDDLGTALTDPAGSDPTERVFEVLAGDTPQGLAPRLEEDGFITSQRAFVFEAIQGELAPRLQAGLFVLRRDMTPGQVVNALITARVVVSTVDVTFREGLRLEQMTALLEITESAVDPQAFYDLVTHPTAELLAAYPWLSTVGRPDGASLEGFLYPATYTLVTAANGGPFEITTAEGLVRMMLDKFQTAVGEARFAVPEERGLTFYQVLTLAAIVEKEAVLDDERPLIAGVYQNRLDGLGNLHTILNADPTVIYGADTVNLRGIPFADWRDYFFWSVPNGGIQGVDLPEDLAGYQSYKVRGLPPGPICSPTVASIDAALEPDTGTGYLFFLAIPDGGGAHAFAKTEAEHNANRKKYGYD